MMAARRRRHPSFFATLLVLLLQQQLLQSTDAFLPKIDRRRLRQISTTTISPTRIQAVAKSGGKLVDNEDLYSETVLAKDIPRPVLVFFSAPWCGPCRLTNPVVKEVMKQFTGDIDVVEVCTDDLAEVAEQAGIVSIPTIQFYYGGEVMDTIVGCVAKSVLSNAVEKMLDDVKQGRGRQ